MSHRYMSVWVYHDGRTHLPVLQPWEEAIVEVYKLPLEKQCEGLTALKNKLRTPAANASTSLYRPSKEHVGLRAVLRLLYIHPLFLFDTEYADDVVTHGVLDAWANPHIKLWLLGNPKPADATRKLREGLWGRLLHCVWKAGLRRPPPYPLRDQYLADMFGQVLAKAPIDPMSHPAWSVWIDDLCTYYNVTRDPDPGWYPLP